MFRKIMYERNAQMEYIEPSWVVLNGANDDNFMVMCRGREGIFILNKSGIDFNEKFANL